jgi:hypothetical protein
MTLMLDDMPHRALLPTGQPSILEPLTFQQRYWHAFCQPNDLSNRLWQVFAIRLSGPLNAELLSASFEQLIRRHESLRARIIINSQGSYQFVDEFGGCEHIEIIRVPGDPESDPAAAQRVVETLARQKWDLSAGPLFEVKLLKWSDSEHLLFWAINHFISDGWSMSRIFRELWLVYGDLLEGLPPSKSTAAGQLSEYRAWQLQAYKAWTEEHRSYWTARLSGAAGIRWPVDSHAFGDGDRIDCTELLLPETLTTEVQNVAIRARTLVLLVLLTAYSVAIGRWCNQTDFVVSTTAHGRDRPEHESIIGCLAHPIYLRVQLQSDEPLTDLLIRLTEEYRNSALRKDFGGVVTDNLHLKSGAGFQWLPWDPEELNGAPSHTESTRVGLTGKLFTFEDANPAFGQFTILPAFWNSGMCIRGGIWYRTRLFSRETIERLSSEVKSLLQEMVDGTNGGV